MKSKENPSDLINLPPLHSFCPLMYHRRFSMWCNGRLRDFALEGGPAKEHGAPYAGQLPPYEAPTSCWNIQSRISSLSALSYNMYWLRYWHQHLTMDQDWELLVLSFRVWPSPGSSEDELPTLISHINQQVELFRNISGESKLDEQIRDWRWRSWHRASEPGCCVAYQRVRG